MSALPEKPLGIKAYGSIPHLPGSRRGPADKGLSDSQARICTFKTRDKHDKVIVQEKLDGSCVSVAKINGEIIPLIRAGYRASSSNYSQHRYFHDWVMAHHNRFHALLADGERCVGEWLLQVHGTRYILPHEPFVIFDLMRGIERSTWDEVATRCETINEFTVAHTVHVGPALSIPEAIAKVSVSAHGAQGNVEGAVWRVERHGKVDFLGKFVRPDKIDGEFLPCKTGLCEVWNVDPADLGIEPSDSSDDQINVRHGFDASPDPANI